jgi:hypothetical protein
MNILANCRVQNSYDASPSSNISSQITRYRITSFTKDLAWANEQSAANSTKAG